MENIIYLGGGKREQSIEMLRIFLMTLIVFGHIIRHGANALGQGTETSYSLTPFYFYHVDAFVFISGYFGITLKWRKFLMLITKMVIYSMVAIGLASLMMPNFQISVSSFLHNVYPLSACDWWFMSQYLFLMLLAPISNPPYERKVMSI